MERSDRGKQVAKAIKTLDIIKPKLNEVQPCVSEEAKKLAYKCHEIEGKLGIALFDPETVASQFQYNIHKDAWPFWVKEHQPLLAFHIKPEKKSTQP